MPPGVPQRPSMGSRTSSAPEGGLYKLDGGRRPSSAAKVGHTLLEEDEGSSSTSHETPKRSRSRHRSDEVLSILRLDRIADWMGFVMGLSMANSSPFACRNTPNPIYRK